MNTQHRYQRTKRFLLTLDGKMTFAPYLVDDPRRQRFHINGQTHYLVFKRNGTVRLYIDGVAYPFNIDGATTIHLEKDRRIHQLQFRPAATKVGTRNAVRHGHQPPGDSSADQLNYVTNLITQLMQNGLLPPPASSNRVHSIERDYFAISTFGLDAIPTLRSTNNVDHHAALLYDGHQCTSCGLRLPSNEAMQTHLTWHLSEDQSTEQVTSRRWYSSLTSWVRPPVIRGPVS